MSQLQQILLGCIVGFVLHEFAHIVAAWVCGVRVKRVGFSWRGIYTVRESGTRSANIAISLCGPLTNLALAVFAWRLLFHFAEVNLVLGLYNLLPLSGSDGQRVLAMLRVIPEIPSNNGSRATAAVISATAQNHHLAVQP